MYIYTHMKQVKLVLIKCH